VKAASNVTGLLGIMKLHGLLEQETPCVVDQLANCQPGLGEAVTLMGELTVSEQPFGQFGLTEP
jgi:hypothetical protein